MIKKDIAIIGGGASGLVAAISASRAGAKCMIIEHTDRVGKKILATGNGKCNYTNDVQGDSFYRGEDPAFARGVIGQFGVKETVRFFYELGIYPKVRAGYYYPASEQASSVLDVLRLETERLKVLTLLSQETEYIDIKDGGFVIKTTDNIIRADRLIVATGLLAAPKTGSDGSFIRIIKSFGHNIIDICPALVQLKCSGNFWSKISGVRAQADVTIYADGKYEASEAGELQLASYGISGIPVFCVSRYAAKALKHNKRVTAEIDFAKEICNTSRLDAILNDRFHTFADDKSCLDALNGMFNKKLNALFIDFAGIDPQKKADTLNDSEMARLIDVIRHFKAEITGTRGFEDAQVCAGGVDTAELDGMTLESKLVSGLYFAGEVIDIDGSCGGYNLQWAWSSGMAAGRYAACSLKE